MKKMFFVLLMIFPLISTGAIEPIMFNLTGGTSYTVPTGKVLLVEHVSLSSDYSTTFALIFEISEKSYRMTLSAETERHSFTRPIKVPEKTSITTNVGSRTLSVFGLLVDASDLYASIQSETENIICQNGFFSMEVLATSPRPAVLGVKGSDDLLAWHDVPDVEIAKANPNTYSVTVPISDKKKYYLKHLLRSVTP